MSWIKSQNTPFWRRLLGLLKACSWKSKMKNVVEYDAYWYILLVGSIYVTKSVFFKENPKSTSSCKPRHPGSGTAMGQGKANWKDSGRDATQANRAEATIGPIGQKGTIVLNGQRQQSGQLDWGDNRARLFFQSAQSGRQIAVPNRANWSNRAHLTDWV